MSKYKTAQVEGVWVVQTDTELYSYKDDAQEQCDRLNRYIFNEIGNDDFQEMRGILNNFYHVYGHIKTRFGSESICDKAWSLYEDLNAHIINKAKDILRG